MPLRRPNKVRLSELLDQARSEGQIDSEGQFTLSPAKALEKLRSYRSPVPDGWLRSIVGAAVAGDATCVELSRHDRDFLCEHDGAVPTGAELETLISRALSPSAPAFQRELAIGLIEGSRVASKGVLLTVTAGSQNLSLELKESGMPRVETVRSGSGGRRTTRVRLRGWQPIDLHAFREACQWAPIPITLDGAVLNRPVEFGAPLVVREVTGGPGLGLTVPEAPVRARKYERFSALLTLAGQLEGLFLLRNGLLCGHSSGNLGFPSACAIVTAQHLRMDLSDLEVIEDDLFEGFLESLRCEFVDMAWDLFAYVSRDRDYPEASLPLLVHLGQQFQQEKDERAVSVLGWMAAVPGAVPAACRGPLWSDLAWLLLEQQRFHEVLALSVSVRAVLGDRIVHEDEPGVLSFLAHVGEAARRISTQDALDEWARLAATLLGPGSSAGAESWVHLARLHRERGDLNGAEQVLSRALARQLGVAEPPVRWRPGLDYSEDYRPPLWVRQVLSGEGGQAIVEELAWLRHSRGDPALTASRSLFGVLRVSQSPRFWTLVKLKAEATRLVLVHLAAEGLLALARGEPPSEDLPDRLERLIEEALGWYGEMRKTPVSGVPEGWVGTRMGEVPLAPLEFFLRSASAAAPPARASLRRLAGGFFETAEGELQTALRLQESRRGSEHRATRGTRNLLAELYLEVSDTIAAAAALRGAGEDPIVECNRELLARLEGRDPLPWGLNLGLPDNIWNRLGGRHSEGVEEAAGTWLWEHGRALEGLTWRLPWRLRRVADLRPREAADHAARSILSLWSYLLGSPVGPLAELERWRLEGND